MLKTENLTQVKTMSSKHTTVQTQIEQALLANLIKLGPQVLASSALVAVIFYAIGYGGLDFFWLTTWFIVNLFITGVRFYRIRNMRQDASSHSKDRHYHIEYTVGAVISGIGWASIALFFENNIAVHLQLFILILLVGLPVSSLSTNTNSLWVYFSFSVPVFIALIWVSLKIDQGEWYFLLMALVHITITYITVFRLHNSFRDNIKTHLLNNDLVLEMTQVNLELETLAYIDPLTKLHNRRYFSESAEKQLLGLSEQSYPLAFFMVDMDQFKYVNDTFGHHAGDRLLSHVAAKLQSAVEAIKQTGKLVEVSRLGGDEFIVMMQYDPNQNDLALIAEQILREVHTELIFDETAYIPKISIGIASTDYQPTSGSLSSLLKMADTAMYQTKRAGGDSYGFYTTQ